MLHIVLRIAYVYNFYKEARKNIPIITSKILQLECNCVKINIQFNATITLKTFCMCNSL